MYSDNLKLRVSSCVDIAIAEDKYWVVVTIQERLYRAQWQVHIIRILAENLVYAKMYMDFISVGLLKWQAEQNQDAENLR